MNGKTSRTSKIAASVLIFCNLVTMLVCALVFALSLWVVASPDSFAGAVKIFGNPTLKLFNHPIAVSKCYRLSRRPLFAQAFRNVAGWYGEQTFNDIVPRMALLSEATQLLQLGVGGAVLSGFFFFISFMGIYGAITGSQFLLFMYATLVILLLLLECAVMYYITSNLVEKGVQEPNDYLTHALRLMLQCCEQNITSSPPEGAALPWSCCGAEAYPTNCTLDRVYHKGCQQATVAWLNRYETSIYVCLATLHVILSLCSLLRRALSASQSYT